jgi:hypothetical protein
MGEIGLATRRCGLLLIVVFPSGLIRWGTIVFIICVKVKKRKRTIGKLNQEIGAVFFVIYFLF